MDVLCIIKFHNCAYCIMHYSIIHETDTCNCTQCDFFKLFYKVKYWAVTIIFILIGFFRKLFNMRMHHRVALNFGYFTYEPAKIMILTKHCFKPKCYFPWSRCYTFMSKRTIKFISELQFKKIYIYIYRNEY